ncbi:MAG TPA: DUF4118 domain-containing protein [Actinotalea sp.]|nr:DUF4118 domain-containing protein [Actinotalea sp.]HRA50146.1 DUF4118 domain-containing protein [Actinotalea sp.]
MPARRSVARGLPHPAAGLSAGRRTWGLAVGVTAVPLLTVALVATGDTLALGSVLLLYLLSVVLVAAIGGLLPGVLAAAAAVLTANWFLIPPFHTLFIESRDAVVELVVFAVVSLVVSITVDLAARDRARAARGQVEIEILSQMAARPVSELDLPRLLEQVRSTFGMSSAALVRTGSSGEAGVVAGVGPAVEGEPSIRVPASAELELVAHGPLLFAEDRSVLERLAAAAARAWESQHLAAQAGQLAEADRVRSALLAAVGHDLRTPLAGLKAAVSSLRQDDVAWAPQEQAELLATIEDSADRLGDLIANILDMTRIQVGAVTARPSPVAVDEIASRALLDVATGSVVLDVPDSLPLVLADAGLLERVVANLLDNALRHSPPGRPVVLSAGLVGGQVELRVVDRGPGVPAELWSAMFAPFQRLGDRTSTAGAGLGLAIVQGFCSAMGIAVEPEETPGGGLTMRLTLPVVPPVTRA